MKRQMATAMTMAAVLGLVSAANAAETAKAPAAKAATEAAPSAPAAGEGFKLIHVADLAQWMQGAKPNMVHVYDANNEDTRKKDGLIPGAVTLPSANRYDVARTLPTDKAAKLVFYCANTKCMASHDAAKRAVAAGYQDVSVMADGIEGWKSAGKPTTKM